MWRNLVQLNPLVKLGVGAVVVIILLVIGYRFGGAGISSQDNSGTISVRRLGLWEDAEPKLRFSQPFVFNASTHVGTIRDLSLDGKVFLEADGVRYPVVGQPVASTTHHDTWLVFLPRFDMAGEPLFEREEGYFDILIEGVDIPAHRVFTFNYPLPLPGARQLTPTRVMMLIGATMAAMLLTCTPCLVGSLTVGSMAMGTAFGSESENAASHVRKEMIKRTLVYLVALIVAYAAVAIAASAFDVSIDDIRPIEVMGGVLLVIVGFGFLRSWGPLIKLENSLVKLVLKISPEFSKYVTSDDPDPEFGSGSSTAMGASLAMVCSVAGAPTLTTAIIFPVMIFAGLDNVYWSLLILLVYLVVTAIPFFLIAIGLGEFLLSLSMILRRRLLVANAFLLIGLGAMLVLSPEAVAGVLSAPARLIIEPLSFLF
jgi:cytochrome c biogenesis protein CcdA